MSSMDEMLNSLATFGETALRETEESNTRKDMLWELSWREWDKESVLFWYDNTPSRAVERAYSGAAPDHAERR